MNKYFNFKNVLIIGASRGIGRALSFKFAELGANLFIAARNEDNLRNIVETIRSKGGKADYAICDVTIKSDVKNTIQKANDILGKIDIAIINSGINGSEGFDNFDSEVFKRIYNVNIYGILHSLEYLIPIMKQNNSGIIAGVSSLADVYGFPGSGAYCSSKAAATTILEAVRLELARFNIKVITIKPGFVYTDMTKDIKYPMPFIIDAEKASDYIVKGIKKEKNIISFPFMTKMLVGIAKLLPANIMNFVFKNREFRF